jgi:hypothetical protein
MSSSPVTTDSLTPRRSEAQFLPISDDKEKIDSAARATDIHMLAPLLVGMAVVVLFVILYAFLLGALG